MSKPTFLKVITGIVLIFFTIITYASAQVAVDYHAISKIIITENTGGMLGGSLTTNEVVRRKDKWIVLETEDARSWIRNDDFFSKKHPAFSHKGTHVFEKELNEQTVKNLLVALKNPPVKFTPGITGITAAYLKENAGKLWNQYNGLTAEEKEIFLKAINQARVDSVIKIVLPSDPTDVYADCSVKIIKNNHDTISVDATNLHAYMLPWVINKYDTTYNKSISSFVMSALGADTTCNLKRQLLGGTLYGDIYDMIYRDYCEELFADMDYEAKYPVAFDMLKKTYRVSDVRDGSGFVFIRLQPKALPSNIFISDALCLDNPDSVNHAMALKDIFAAVLKHSNFVFNYAADTLKGKLIFEAPGDSISLFRNEQHGLPYLSRFNDSQVITFSYQSKTNENDYSTWYLLPNGRLLLDYHGYSVLGIPTATLDSYSYWRSFVLFDEKGNLIKLNSSGEAE